MGSSMGKLMGTSCNSISKKELLYAMNAILKRSASGAGQGSIDNRIEQAMDLVKSHLMSAVRSEVEELREKIAKLEDTVQVLSRENDTLRNPAQRGLLGPQHLNSLPPPEPAHPALQPPQH